MLNNNNFHVVIKHKDRNINIKRIKKMSDSKFTVDSQTYKIDPDEIYFLNKKKYGFIPYTVPCSFYNENNPLPLKSDFKSVEVTATALTNMIENNVLEQMYSAEKKPVKMFKYGAIFVAIFVIVIVSLQLTGVIDMSTMMAGLK